MPPSWQPAPWTSAVTSETPAFETSSSQLKEFSGPASRLQPVTIEPFEFDWAHWFDSAWALADWTLSLGKPLAIGLVALALTLAAAGYCAVQIAWRAYVTLAWRTRRNRRTRHPR